MIVASNNYLGIESIGDVDFYGSKINIIGKEKEITMKSARFSGSRLAQRLPELR